MLLLVFFNWFIETKKGSKAYAQIDQKNYRSLRFPQGSVREMQLSVFKGSW